MFSWLKDLDAASQAAVISGVFLLGSGIINAFIAFLGYWITLQTSTKANNEIAAITKQLKLVELENISKIKLAEARISWIEEFRSELAELYAAQYELGSRKFKFRKMQNGFEKAEQQQTIDELNFRISKLKSRLFMRIDPQTKEDDELRLVKLLSRAVPSSSAEASKLRKSIREETRSILNREWKKAKEEITNTVKGT